MNENNSNIPKMMTVRQIARTGLLPENALRVLLKQGRLPVIYSGRKALINYNTLCKHLNELSYIA